MNQGLRNRVPFFKKHSTYTWRSECEEINSSFALSFYSKMEPYFKDKDTSVDHAKVYTITILIFRRIMEINFWFAPLMCLDFADALIGAALSPLLFDFIKTNSCIDQIAKVFNETRETTIEELRVLLENPVYQHRIFPNKVSDSDTDTEKQKKMVKRKRSQSNDSDDAYDTANESEEESEEESVEESKEDAFSTESDADKEEDTHMQDPYHDELDPFNDMQGWEDQSTTEDETQGSEDQSMTEDEDESQGSEDQSMAEDESDKDVYAAQWVRGLIKQTSFIISINFVGAGVESTIYLEVDPTFTVEQLKRALFLHFLNECESVRINEAGQLCIYVVERGGPRPLIGEEIRKLFSSESQINLMMCLGKETCLSVGTGTTMSKMFKLHYSS